MGAVVSFFRPARSTQGNWSQQELAEFYRVEAALIRSGMRITSEQGLSDEADPCFVFCAVNGETVIHFARIDGNYVVTSDALDHPMRGSDFRMLLDDIAAEHPNLLPLHRTGTGTKLVIHPAALLAAIVAAAALALAPDDAFADDLGGASTGHDSGPLPPDAAKATLEPQPAKLKAHDDSREQGGNRRQVEAVLFSAMAFAAQAAAADDLDHRSGTGLPDARPAGAPSHLAQGEVGPSAGSSSGSVGAQTVTAQTLSPLIATSGASSTSASATQGGSERPSVYHQDRAEISGDASGHMKVAAAASAPTGAVDGPPGAPSGTTDTAGPARSSGSQHTDGASDTANASDAARDAKQVATSTGAADSVSGRTANQTTLQTLPQDNAAKTTTVLKKQPGDEDASNGSGNGKGSGGSSKPEQSAEKVAEENGQSGESGSSHGTSSSSSSGQGSSGSAAAPGQLKKADQTAPTSDASDTTAAGSGNGEGSANSSTAPGDFKKADKAAAPPATSDTAAANDGNGSGMSEHAPGHAKKGAAVPDTSDPANPNSASGPGEVHSETAPGQMRKAEKAAASDNAAPADGNGHGPGSSEAAPGQAKKAEKLTAVSDSSDATGAGGHGPGNSDTAPGHAKHEDKLAAVPDPSAPAANGPAESAPGYAKHDAQGLAPPDAATSDASASGTANGRPTGTGGPHDPSGSSSAKPQAETAGSSVPAGDTTPPPSSQGQAPGHHKLQGSSTDGTDPTTAAVPAQTTVENGSPAAHSKSGIGGDPTSPLDEAEAKSGMAVAKIDPSGNLVFAPDHQGPGNGSAPPVSPPPDAHTDVGLVGIATHNGVIHHLDFHH